VFLMGGTFLSPRAFALQGTHQSLQTSLNVTEFSGIDFPMSPKQIPLFEKQNPEISKLIMYRFYYVVLKARYGDKCTLLFTDTDSLCCEIGTRDLYEDFGEMLDELDTSNFDAFVPRQNRRVLGKFKSETGSVAPKEFVGLRAKMYSLRVPADPRKSFKKAKGIQKHYVKKEVNHKPFLDVLRRDRKDTRAKFRNFKSTNHVVNTLEIIKLS